MNEIALKEATTLKQKPADESKLGFGKIFTDHMLLINYDEGQGWHDARVVPYGNFELDPACMVLHYGQTIFEGSKVYRAKDGGFNLFRIKDNFARMNRSATRMGMPNIDVELCMDGLMKLLSVDKDWTPHQDGTALYIRPTMIATDPFLGVAAAKSYLFYIILSPVGAYYASGLAPVSIYVEDEYVRAVRGGVGFAKTAANYAASILAGDEAKHKGFAQVLWLDGVEQRYVEEVGSMNMMFVFGDKLVTPKLNGSILPGITRDSVLKLAASMGYQVSQERVSIDEIVSAAKTGALTEAFGTGTAAVVSPVSQLTFKGENYAIGDGSIGKLTKKMYDTLTDIQYGRIADAMGWITRIK